MNLYRVLMTIDSLYFILKLVQYLSIIFQVHLYNLSRFLAQY